MQARTYKPVMQVIFECVCKGSLFLSSFLKELCIDCCFVQSLCIIFKREHEYLLNVLLSSYEDNNEPVFKPVFWRTVFCVEK